MAVDMHTQTRLPEAPPSARPVQSRPRIGGVVFQFISTLVMINGFKGLDHIDIPASLKVVDFTRFLTNWGLGVAILTTSVGVVSDVLPGVSAIRSLKRGLLLIAFPMALTISTIYWSLILVAPSLILPSISPNTKATGEPSSSPQAPSTFRIPLWIDLSLHLVPAAVLFVEFFVRERKYRPPVSTIGAILLSSLFAGSYTGYIEYRALSDGRFPYPFLRADMPLLRLAIYIGSTGFAYGAFKFLNALHR